MRFLRTNTATRVTVGPFFDKTDGITPETALTVTSCKLTLMVDTGGVPTLVLDTNPTASGGNNDMVHVTNDDAGFYDLELAAADVNYVGRAMLAITDAATHCPVFHEFMILPANIYDSLVGGTDTLQADVTEWLGTACATPTVAGVPEVDMTHMAGGTQTVTDLKDFADAGYDPATHKVQGVVLADTLTAYTNNTPQSGDSYAIVNHGTYGNAAIENLVDGIEATLGTPAGASVSADIASIKTDSGNIYAIVNHGTYGNSALNTTLTSMKGATFDTATDSLEAIRNRGDAAWITAVGFSTHTAADVWAVGTRVLTAGTNIVLAKGSGVTGFNDIAASDILTTALTEGYAADGATFTLSQGLYMMWAA